MIVRMWRGTVPSQKAEAYLGLMRTVALPDYQAISGNSGAYALYRNCEDTTEVVMLTFWESIDDIRRFAGDSVDRAKYYDFDADFLIEWGDTVSHFDCFSLPDHALVEFTGAFSMPGGLLKESPSTLLEMAGEMPPKVEPSRSALVIIDAQNDYLDGAPPLSNHTAAVSEIARLRAWAHRLGVLVVHVQHKNCSGSALFGSERGARIVDALTPAPNEPIVTKTLPNSFAGTDLDALLRHEGRGELILTGFMTHMCLDSTTRAALDLGYGALLVASATTDRDLRDLRGKTDPAKAVKRLGLAALADRFAWVFPDAAALEASVQEL